MQYNNSLFVAYEFWLAVTHKHSSEIRKG